MTDAALQDTLKELARTMPAPTAGLASDKASFGDWWRRADALLARHRGNISRAAAEAGIDRNYIHRLVKKYGLEVDRG